MLSASRELAQKHEDLARQIASLEHFICDAPARAAEQRLDRMQTIPPPEAFEGVALESEEPRRPLRQHAALARADRRRNMVVFIVAAGVFAVFLQWLSQAL